MVEYARQVGQFSRNVRLLLTANLLVNAGIGFFVVLFNLYLMAVGKPLGFLGELSAANTVATAAASLTTRALLRRYDARLVMTGGILVFGLAALAEVYITADAALLALTSLAGAGIALATTPASPYLAEHSSPGERAHVFSVFFAVLTGGLTLGSFASGLLPLLVVGRLPGFSATSLSTYRFELTVACAVILLAAVPYSRLAAGHLGQQGLGVPEVETPLRASTTRDVGAMLVAVGVIAASLGLIAPFYNLYFAAVTHATPTEIGFIFSLTSILTTVATLSSAALGRGMGRLLAFNLARLLSVGCLVALALNSTLLVAAVAYMGYSILLNVAAAIDYNFVMELLPAQRRQSAASLRVAVFNGCSALTSIGAGALIQAHGYRPAFLLAAAGMLISAVLYFGYFHMTGYRETRGWFLTDLTLGRPPRRARMLRGRPRRR